MISTPPKSFLRSFLDSFQAKALLYVQFNCALRAGPWSHWGEVEISQAFSPAGCHQSRSPTGVSNCLDWNKPHNTWMDQATWNSSGLWRALGHCKKAGCKAQLPCQEAKIFWKLPNRTAADNQPSKLETKHLTRNNIQTSRLGHLISGWTQQDGVVEKSQPLLKWFASLPRSCCNLRSWHSSCGSSVRLEDTTTSLSQLRWLSFFQFLAE